MHVRSEFAACTPGQAGRYGKYWIFLGEKKRKRFGWISVCRYLRYHFIILLVYLSTYLLSRYVLIPLGRSPSHSVIVIVIVVVLCTEGGREGG